MTTTHALLVGKVQRKERNGVAQIGRRRIISGSAEILEMSAMTPRRPSARARNPAEIPALRPELRLPTAAAQKRMVSVARIRQDPRKSARPFKGIIFPDVSEFESYMPSHAVGSPPADMPQRCFALRQPAEILACGRKRPESRFRLFRSVAGAVAVAGGTTMTAGIGHGHARSRR